MKSNIQFIKFDEMYTEQCCRLIESCVSDYEGIGIEAYEKFRNRTHDEKFAEYIKNHCLYLALMNGIVVGMGGIQDNMVKLMYVDKDNRHFGIGREIHMRLEDEAKTRLIPIVKIDASLNSVGFYLKIGYKEIERTKWMLDGSEVNNVIMQKYI